MKFLRCAFIFFIFLVLFHFSPARAVIKISVCDGGIVTSGWTDPRASGPGVNVSGGCHNEYAFWDEGGGSGNGNVAPSGGGQRHVSANKASTVDSNKRPSPKKIPCDEAAGKSIDQVADPIILSSGAKVDTITDFRLPGEMGLKFERYYNSRFMCLDGVPCVGAGAWTTNLDYHLDPPSCEFDPDAGHNVCNPGLFFRPDGSRLYFRGGRSFSTQSASVSSGSATLTSNDDGTFTLRDEDARVLTFNSQGMLLAIKDSQGIGWTLSRPDSNTVVVTHTNGQSFSLAVINGSSAYGASKEIRVTDPAGNVYLYDSTTSAYDGLATPVSHLGNLNKVTLPGSPSTVLTYEYYPDAAAPVGTNGSYMLLKEVDYNGVAHDTTTYDSVGRATMSSLADGSERTSITYGSNATGPTATATNPLGHVSVYQYDGLGNLVSVQGAAALNCPATYASMSYDANGFMTSSTDNNGIVTKYTYDANGLLQQKIEAAGTSVQRTIDYVWDTASGVDRLLFVTVEGWSKTTYTYSPAGWLSSEAVTNLSNRGSANQTLTETYDRTLYANGLTHSLMVTHPSSGSRDTDVYTYDTLGRLVSMANGLGQAITYSNYNALGEPGTVVGPNGDRIDYTYDARGRVVSEITHPNGSTATWSYTYDGFGLPATQTDPDGKVTMWHRDGTTMRVDVVARTEKDGDSTETLSYNANGDVTSDVVQRGSDVGLSLHTSYDALGRRYQTTGMHGQLETYSYDANGNVVSITNAAGHIVRYQYDALNRVSKVVETGGGTLGAPSVSLPESNTTGSYTVSWSGIGSATSYTVQEQLNGGGWSTVYSGSATSKAIGDRVTGTYGYHARACNPGGCGNWGATSSVDVLLPPPAPSNVTVPATSSGGLTISWTSASTATSYTLEHQLNSGAWTGLYSGSATSDAITEVATGSYVYRVKACNTSGCGPYATSSAVAVTIPPSTAPGLSVPSISGTGSYTVSWTGVGGATSYMLQEQVNGGSWTTSYSGSAASAALTGKSNGSTYSYQVRACNAGGCGPWSGIQSVQIIFPPSAPTNAHQTMMGSPKVIYNRVLWDAMSSATQYDVKLDSSATLVYSGSDTSYLIESASFPDEPDGTHVAFVRACNAGGCSAWTKVPPYLMPAPPPLTGPSASSNGSYTLSWNSGGALVDYYVLQQQINGGGWSTVYVGSNLSNAFSGMADGTYGYQLQSCMVSTCGGPTPVFTVTVAHPPGTPASISVPGSSSGSVAVNWSGVGGATSYTLEHQKNGGAWGTVFSGNATSQAVTETSNGSYVYQVKACNAGGCSGYRTSGTVTVTLPAGPPMPTGAQITSVGSPKVVTYSATWNAVSGATYYEAKRNDSGAQVYSGTDTRFVIGKASPDVGPPYYSFSVRACNAGGCSGWAVGY